MITSQNPYRNALDVSLRIGWKIEDVLPEGARLDLTRTFLPESLARVERSAALRPADKRTLNQIRGHSYLRMFGIIEEFIVPFISDHARERFGAADYDDYEVRALLQFTSEEAKHIHLFKRFAARFEADFGGGCAIIGPASEICAAVLGHHPLGVALATLQGEWMTQSHYVDSIREDGRLDPLIKSLLHQHWLEESQHVRLDGLIVEAIAGRSSAAEIARGIEDYRRIGALLEEGLYAQVDLDLQALEARRGDVLGSAERQVVREQQRAAYRYTFWQSGAEHPKFVAALRALESRAAGA